LSLPFNSTILSSAFQLYQIFSSIIEYSNFKAILFYSITNPPFLYEPEPKLVSFLTIPSHVFHSKASSNL